MQPLVTLLGLRKKPRNLDFDHFFVCSCLHAFQWSKDVVLTRRIDRDTKKNVQHAEMIVF